MTEQSFQMIDMLLRIVGMSFITAAIWTICLTAGALFVWAIVRATPARKR